MNLRHRTHQPTRDAICRAGAELHHMSKRLLHVENALEPLILSGDRVDVKGLNGALQEIDILLQSSAALASFLANIGQTEDKDPGDILSSALAELPLKDMARRLAGGQTDDNQTLGPEWF